MALWGCSQTTGGMQARTSASWTLVRPPGPARLACVTATKDPQGIHEGHLYKKNQPSSIPVKDLAPGAAILASLMCCPPVLAETGGLFGLNMPLWLELSALIGFNVLGASIFLNIIKDMQDSSEPLTVAKVQIGLLEYHPRLQSKLAQLSGMMQVGQVGSWLILEEAIVELLHHQRHIAYADVQLQELTSKKRAYGLFGAVTLREEEKAEAEQLKAHMHGMASLEEDGGVDACSPMGGWMGMLGAQDCTAKHAHEATVVTLVVAARGHLDIQPTVKSWPELRHALQQLTGLTSDKIMGVELLWTPTRENEYLTRLQLQQDYPNLLPLQREV